jgi:CheY-like chemotaxis protein
MHLRIFILEDEKNRIDWFKENLKNLFFDLTIATSYDEGIKLFSLKEKYDLILLDHDLGGRMYVDSNDENTGFNFCNYLIEKNVAAPVIIHSMNTVGALKMEELLSSNDFIVSKLPFGDLVSLWNIGQLKILGIGR